MGTREHKVEKYLESEIRKRGGICWKWTSPGRAGVPDRIAWVRGLVLAIEVKTLDGVVSDVQMQRMKELTDAGAKVAVVFGRTGVEDLMEKIDAES